MPPQPDSITALPRCPYLGSEVSDNRLGEPIEYPSFENRCWTTARPIPLLLTDQATLCLCSGYASCPRFLAARASRQGQERPTTVPPPADSDAISSALKELEADVQASVTSQMQSRRRWGWIGAGLIFMSSLLCGGLFAAYVGWQMVRDELAAVPPGSVDTLAAAAQAQSNTQPQTYIIVTATSEPQPIIAQAPGGQSGPTENQASAPSYPVAVEPTPRLEGNNIQIPPPSLSEIAQETNATAAAPQTNLLVQSEPTPILDFELAVPTRRPTPFLDIPTSTPAADLTPTLAPTDTPPPLGTPVVVFYAEDKNMQPGDCTTVYWHVENVKAVYYENMGVDGRGEHEECVRDDDGNFNLMVILQNGATQMYTVTVDVVPPTDTPAPTPTRTEVPLPTPTWTPSIPTATPTPEPSYGAKLEASGNTNLTCARGTTCETDLYVANIGSAIDNITVRFTEAASWPRQICRLDGVCSESQMTLVDMGLSSSGVVRLRVTVPPDASSETMTYRLQALSERSGGRATSAIITIQIAAGDVSSN